MHLKNWTDRRPKSLRKQIEASPGAFEKVENTGYMDKQGREIIGQYVFHGQERVACCRDCGGALEPKTMRVEERDGLTHIVNGLKKPVEVGEGRVILIIVCSRFCLDCAAHQRMFPEGVAGWVRHELYAVWEQLVRLFDPGELQDSGPLRSKRRRPWDTLDFYGENATLYRWRARAARWFGPDEKKNVVHNQ